MTDAQPIILGEFRCTLDQRYRLSIPETLADPLVADSRECMLAKERPGCLSLWSMNVWRSKVEVRIEVAKEKIEKGLSDQEIGRVQLLGRLLSTRHQEVELAGRGRLLIPKGFREFLGVRPAKGQRNQGEVMVVGAAVCIEIWAPAAWLEYLGGRMPKFRRLLDRLC
jgi:MraZ protein